jgi:hypothetical protein
MIGPASAGTDRVPLLESDPRFDYVELSVSFDNGDSDTKQCEQLIQ